MARRRRRAPARRRASSSFRALRRSRRGSARGGNVMGLVRKFGTSYAYGLGRGTINQTVRRFVPGNTANLSDEVFMGLTGFGLTMLPNATAKRAGNFILDKEVTIAGFRMGQQGTLGILGSGNSSGGSMGSGASFS